jgi:hypothetical protein
MSEILSEQGFEMTLRRIMDGLDTPAMLRRSEDATALLSTCRALQAQVRELEKDLALSGGDGNTKRLLENHELKARITALEAERDIWKRQHDVVNVENGTFRQINTELQQRITQLEWALKALMNEAKGMIGAFPDSIRQVVGTTNLNCLQRRIAQAQHLLSSREGERPREDALAPGAYREWCRDPTMCQDKGRCPKDPTCAD